ncbi:MAG: cation:dicarboxylate symporter family transporter [Candidatus Zixiibacteriota bacterium]
MNTMTSTKLPVFTLAAAVLGVLLGIVLPGLMLALAFVGDLFINVLLILFIPLVGSAIITGVSAFAGKRQIAKAALATLSLFLGTTIAAILIGLILTIIIKPGVGINTGAGFVPGEIVNAPVTQSLDFLSEIIPSNIINAVTHGKFLGWMIVLTVLAAVLGTLGQKAKPVTDFFEAIYAVVQKVLGVVIKIVPVGIFFVIGAVVARNSGSFGTIFDGLTKFSLVLLIGFLVHALVTIPAVLKFFGRRSPLEYFLNVLPALKTALVSASPTAALPITFENSIERNKIDSRIAAMTLPIGSSLNVNGRAMYVTVSALFIAQAFDVQLGFLGTLYVAVAALFFSLGTGTVPFVGMLTLVSVFDFAGFPTTAYAGIGLIFVIDWFWSRIFAVLDVWSDTAVAAAVEESVLAEIALPQRRERVEPESRPRFERGRERRDFPPRRGRDVRQRQDFRHDRPPRPYSRPERETIKSEIPPTRPETAGQSQKPAVRMPKSPFELKAEVDKTFNIESIKAGEKPPAKSPVFKKEVPSAGVDDRRKLRERKKFERGHDVARKEALDQAVSLETAKIDIKPAPIVSPPRPIAPPPLIREIETSDEVESPKVVAVIEREDKESAKTEEEEAQTSLFGRAPHRKGVRPKSDELPKPVEEAESYSTKEQAFGRGVRRKKTT